METLLTSLGIGEAVVTVLSDRGVPTPVAWTRMKAPNSLMDPSPQATLDAVVTASPLRAKYADVLDRESAYEMLARRLQAAPPAAPAESPAPTPPPPASTSTPRREPKEDPGIVEQVVQSTAFRSMLRSAGTVIGREITRSIFGTRRRR
jgi:hypothetical protein